MGRFCWLRSGLIAFAITALAPVASRAEPSTELVTVLTILDVVPDYAIPKNVEMSSTLLDELARATQQAPGLVSFKILHDASRANHFVIVGVWKDMPAFDAYSGAAATKQFRQAFQPRQGGPFDERVYVDLK